MLVPSTAGPQDFGEQFTYFHSESLQIGMAANWQKPPRCERNHSTNSCVWSTSAGRAIFKPQT